MAPHADITSDAQISPIENAATRYAATHDAVNDADIQRGRLATPLPSATMTLPIRCCTRREVSLATLRPMNDTELSHWLADSKAGFLAELLEAGRPAERAKAFVNTHYAEWFPGGQPADGHHVYVVDDNDARVGIVWLGPHPQRTNDTTVAWLYDFEVEPKQRGRGLGRLTLELAEGAARSLGATRLELNVFGANHTARSLYQSAGYAEVTVTMGKPLDNAE